MFTDAGRTPEADVSSQLTNPGYDWRVPKADDVLHRDDFIERLDRIRMANEQVWGTYSAEGQEMLEAYNQSVAFAHRAFDIFEGVSTEAATEYDWAFVVPARGRHASEVTDFLPVLDERFGATPDQVYRTVSHLAPTVIETYKGTSDLQGAVIYTPAYFDAAVDANDPRRQLEALAAARRRTIEAAQFARRRHQVGLIGLGAVLPGITSYGRSIREEGLVTTTGHGGTVHLVVQITEQAIASKRKAPRVGVLGLGAIGASSLAVLQSSPIIKEYVREFSVYDISSEKIAASSHQSEENTSVALVKAASEREVIERSDVLVAAVTDTLDLDEYERKTGGPIDLNGKIIIDDSQPGYFDRDQVEVRGGKLAWVVGSDHSADGFLHRTNGYRYGEVTGLSGKNAVWGCEAEVGVLALLAQHEKAVRGIVTPEVAQSIGKLCIDAGIRAAWPAQSFGKPVEF